MGVLGQLSLVFAASLWGGVLAKYWGFPALIGSVLVGFLVKSSHYLVGVPDNVFSVLGSAGVVLLLFLAGLEFDLKILNKIGKKVMILPLVAIVGFGFCTWLWLSATGFGTNTSLLLAWILTFSSTVVVVKLLTEKRDINTYVGRLSLMILLIQDLWAMVLLVFLPQWGKSLAVAGFGLIMGKILFLWLVIMWVGGKLVGWLADNVTQSVESTLLFGLAWCFMIVGLVSVLGISPELGAFMAGVSMAGNWHKRQIVYKVTSIRDFFLALFFLSFGYSINLGGVDWGLVVMLTIWVMVGKSLLIWVTARWIGIRQRIAVMTAVNLTQLSEFSLIALNLCLVYGLLTESIVASVSLVTVLTMALSILFMGKVRDNYATVHKVLGALWLEKKSDQMEKAVKLSGHVVLFGCHRMGRSILARMEKTGEKVLVVDYDPVVVEKLINDGKKAIYADAIDEDIFEMVFLKSAKLVVSTLKDVEDSLALLKTIKAIAKVPVIVDAESVDEAKKLYKFGADYVVFPHFLGGWHLGQVLKKMNKGKDPFSLYRSKQIELFDKVYVS